MSIVGQVDPKIQALFDENLAATRSANAEVAAKLKADQDRLAAEAKAREEQHQKDVAASLASAKDVARHGDTQQRKPQWEQWEQRDRSAGELAFGPEDDDGGYSPTPVSAPQPPPPPPVAPPPPPMRARRPARVDDDDDDLSGQTWLS